MNRNFTIMQVPKLTNAQHLIQIFEFHKIENIIISPGSRNAPLTIGFASNSYFKCYSIADERCAAFVALGLAQQLQKPTALLCTSGSALLNYYPAIAEAFYAQIPLLVISADRPQSKIDIGDGQTIRQENVFSNHILFSANLTEFDLELNDNLVQKAIEFSKYKKGPSHINIPFEEPLYEITNKYSSVPNLIPLEKENVEFKLGINAVNQWENASKKMIVIGELFPNKEVEFFLKELIKDTSVLLLYEKNSNLNSLNGVHQIDTFISNKSEDELSELQPDILLTFGGMVVSKKIKSFLRTFKPKDHWHVDELRAYDTYQSLTSHIKTNVVCFLKQLIPIKHNSFNYQEKWICNFQVKLSLQKEFELEVKYSDFKVYQFISNNLPDDVMIQVSNSAAIRYMQLFKQKPNQQFFCNRGTSGIDGSTSTAIGASIASEKKCYFITGDISFFYDSNALWNSYIPSNFKIILINNNGGGIFRILPGHQETEIFNTYFETSHSLTAKLIAKMYQFDYFSAQSELELQEQWSSLNQTEKPAILEIFTPAKENEKVLKDYFSFLNLK